MAEMLTDGRGIVSEVAVNSKLQHSPGCIFWIATAHEISFKNIARWLSVCVVYPPPSWSVMLPHCNLSHFTSAYIILVILACLVNRGGIPRNIINLEGKRLVFVFRPLCNLCLPSILLTHICLMLYFFYFLLVYTLHYFLYKGGLSLVVSRKSYWFLHTIQQHTNPPRSNIGVVFFTAHFGGNQES